MEGSASLVCKEEDLSPSCRTTTHFPVRRQKHSIPLNCLKLHWSFSRYYAVEDDVDEDADASSIGNTLEKR
jgi:hypothetical protein